MFMNLFLLAILWKVRMIYHHQASISSSDLERKFGGNIYCIFLFMYDVSFNITPQILIIYFYKWELGEDFHICNYKVKQGSQLF